MVVMGGGGGGGGGVALVFFNFGGRGEHLPNRDGHFFPKYTQGWTVLSLNMHSDMVILPMGHFTIVQGFDLMKTNFDQYGAEVMVICGLI